MTHMFPQHKVGCQIKRHNYIRYVLDDHLTKQDSVLCAFIVLNAFKPSRCIMTIIVYGKGIQGDFRHG